MEMHQRGLDNLRKASKATHILCATMMDTLGPEIVVINRHADAQQHTLYATAAASTAVTAVVALAVVETTVDTAPLPCGHHGRVAWHTKPLSFVADHLLPLHHSAVPACHRPSEPIQLEAGQAVLLTCDASVAASKAVLPISYPSLSGTGLQPGRTVFVGQYLFTGVCVVYQCAPHFLAHYLPFSSLPTVCLVAASPVPPFPAPPFSPLFAYAPPLLPHTCDWRLAPVECTQAANPPAPT